MISHRVGELRRIIMIARQGRPEEVNGGGGMYLDPSRGNNGCNLTPRRLLPLITSGPLLVVPVSFRGRTH